jgi:putative transposase
MSNYRRARIAGGTWFFTLVTFDRQPYLTTPFARDCLRNALRETRTVQPFRLDAICLLPGHLHCPVTLPDGDADFSARWNRIKGLFSKRYRAQDGLSGEPNPSRRRKGEASLWQRRFREHAIRDENDLCRHLDYIHYNPVKHGHVIHPAAWPWSSLGRYIRLGWYDPDWGMQEPSSIQGMSGLGE